MSAVVLALITALSIVGVFVLLRIVLTPVDSVHTGTVTVPTSLAIARQMDNGDVDVVRYDGSAWETVVPTSTLQSYTVDGNEYKPAIVAVVPNDDFSMVGLLVTYATSASVEFDSAGSRGYVYDVSGETLTAIDEDDPVSPVTWLANGYLVVEDGLEGRAKLFNPSTGAITFVPAVDSIYGMSELPEGVSADETSLVYSADSAEKILRLATPNAGTAVAISGAALSVSPSSYTTSWMSFDPSGHNIALVRQRDDEGNELGGGHLQIFHESSGTWSQPTPVTNSSDYLDFSPAWADDGAKIAFLRAASGPWKTGTATSSRELTPAVMLYDLSGATAIGILSDDAVRQDLLVPGAQMVGAFLESDSGMMHTKLVDLETTETAWAIASQGSTVHTAIGTPRQ